jgi:Domain of unknown function (DUF1963)
MVVWDIQRRAAKELALGAGFGERDADLIVGLARPAARLVAGREHEVASGASKLGGLPDLPPDREWPRGECGPMTFCGQIYTRDVAFLFGVDGWRPSDGLLSFFADKNPDGDDTQAGCVLCLPARGLERAPAPPDLAVESRFDERPLEAVRFLSPPMAELLNADLDHDLDADDWATWGRLLVALGGGTPEITAGHHQLFGNPWQVGMEDPVWMGWVKLAGNDDAEPEDLHDRYRLLAQFTTDQAANVEIADGGAIYFVISVEELAAGRYERTAVHMESH